MVMMWSLRKGLLIKQGLFCLIFTVILILLINPKIIYSVRYRFLVARNYTSKYPYIALIVDNRATPLLVNAVLNAIEHIPMDWKVQIMTPYEHWSYYNNSSLNQFIKINRIFLTRLEQITNGLTSNEYTNILLTSPSFWHNVQGDKVLFFQIDSVLCSNSLYHIKDFLEYDFIGAPWYIGGCCNGGLSIRSRSKILQMLESGYMHYRLHGINEDGWFTDYLPYFNGRVAPISIAKRFAVETIYHPRPFGVHKPHLSTIGTENMNRLCNECPEMQSITSYCQSVRNVNNSTNLNSHLKINTF